MMPLSVLIARDIAPVFDELKLIYELVLLTSIVLVLPSPSVKTIGLDIVKSKSIVDVSKNEPE
jgi:hypothetical protein